MDNNSFNSAYQQGYNAPEKKRGSGIQSVIIGVIIVWLIICTVILVILLLDKNHRSTSQVNPANDGNVLVSQEESNVIEVAKKASPSVVSIITTQTGRISSWSREELQGAGTGVVISSDGYVMTNKHVVKKAQSVTIITNDGEQFSNVKYVGSDPLNDIAFLKINDAKDLPVAQLGDSATVNIGQRVVAIGNSLGQYKNTVTAGIISGKGRPALASSDATSKDVENLTDLLQTDAAINPGNSGGPLINMAGQVIGINTAIASGAQNMGFTIPINSTKGLVKGVLKDGKIEKAYAGIQYLTITPEVRAQHNLKIKEGAYIRDIPKGYGIKPGSPADKAGLHEGDIVIKVNDKDVGTQGGLASLLGEYLPGDKIELTFVRDGKEQKTSLVFDAYKS